jgi:hypothetical protein
MSALLFMWPASGISGFIAPLKSPSGPPGSPLGNLDTVAINPISAQLNLLAVTTRADARTANVR